MMVNANPLIPATLTDKLERWPLSRLREAEHNPRTHSPAQVEQIAASMREFGWTIPVLVDEHGELIAGHGRLAAARLLGLAEAPVLVAKGWTEVQKRAYRIADNRLALNAGWDDELLSAELTGLRDADFNLDLLGFSAPEMSVIIEGWTADLGLLQKYSNRDTVETPGFEITVHGVDVAKKADVLAVLRDALADVEGVEIE
ncbi:ParB/Srx family N-terminal domain-containing protein [Paraburkholderia sp. HD33-4]|uniref:ParB/Srx family N-terminal domain-containing protein n=1 Tax=Paraburkholderia sp. HD33-4 TaxID=2883242 RepID=UPI001F3A1983|nr:ParB/Srx family N-terminal domain-containing protein [Paraburkholderia sp. HD33-4]